MLVALLTIIDQSFSNRATFYHVEFGAGLKSNNHSCLLFSFVFLVAEVILALSLSGAKKANQHSGILPSLVAVGCTVKKKIFSVKVLVYDYGTFKYRF